MIKKIFTVAPIALLLLLTACSPFGPIAVTPVKTYTLSDISAVTPSPIQTHQTITIMPVVAVRGLDTSEMIYQDHPYLLSSFAQNSWIAPPASMITALIGRSLQQTHAFAAVVPGPSLSNTGYLVNGTLLEFYQDFTVDPSEMVISLEVSLIDNQSNAVIADRLFTSKTVTKEDTPYGGVIAANQAINTMMQQVSQFLVTQVAQAGAGS